MDCNNYRAVSLLSNTFKILSNILLANYLTSYNPVAKLYFLLNQQIIVRINLPLFSTVVPSNSCCCCFVVVNTTFSTGLVGVEVNCQLPKPGERSNFNAHKTR